MKKLIILLLFVFSACERKLCPTYSSIDEPVQTTTHSPNTNKNIVSL